MNLKGLIQSVHYRECIILPNRTERMDEKSYQQCYLFDDFRVENCKNHNSLIKKVSNILPSTFVANT